jgi:hypothetical protein
MQLYECPGYAAGNLNFAGNSEGLKACCQEEKYHIRPWKLL